MLTQVEDEPAASWAALAHAFPDSAGPSGAQRLLMHIAAHKRLPSRQRRHSAQQPASTLSATTEAFQNASERDSHCGRAGSMVCCHQRQNPYCLYMREKAEKLLAVMKFQTLRRRAHSQSVALVRPCDDRCCTAAWRRLCGNRSGRARRVTEKDSFRQR